MRTSLNAHTLEFFTHSYIQPLHDSYLNIGYIIAEIEANLARNKTNTWWNKFNLIEVSLDFRNLDNLIPCHLKNFLFYFILFLIFGDFGLIVYLCVCCKENICLKVQIV